MKIVLVFLLSIIAYGQCLPPKSRIIGGEAADFTDFPYLCSVNAPGVMGRGHVCGCSILNEYWVLTAAHCVSYVIYFFIHKNNFDWINFLAHLMILVLFK